MTEVRALVMDYGGVLTDGPSMHGLVARVRAAGFPCALVTDAHAVPDGVADGFDLVALGPSLGARKPDPEVFRRVAAALGVTAMECVVVDDLLRNVSGARAAGAVTVLHRTPIETIVEVEILFGLA